MAEGDNLLGGVNVALDMLRIRHSGRGNWLSPGRFLTRPLCPFRTQQPLFFGIGSTHTVSEESLHTHLFVKPRPGA